MRSESTGWSPRAASRRVARACAPLLALGVLLGAAHAPGGDTLPFFPGERFVYQVRVGKVGTIGRGSMLVEPGETVRDHSTYLLRFDFQARVGVVKVEDRTRSWLDPVRMASLRFQKREKHPLSTDEQQVELFPSDRSWTTARGEKGQSPSDAPLDELSFLYFIRTLPLEVGSVQSFDRHFQPGRNPVTVRVLRRELVKVAAGEFPTLLVEMRVKDPQRYGGEGVIRMNLTDDACRIPVRIESSLPVFGSMVLSLETHTHPVGHRLIAK